MLLHQRTAIVSLVLMMLITAAIECLGVVINDDYFASSGGNIANITGTLDAGYSAFISEWRQTSYPNGPNPADLNQNGIHWFGSVFVQRPYSFNCL
ncbi:MAG: hypothetical protein JW829_06660 [Pirellulales bacterium]|nr:hypothetical protein [Pirellulales bacterium]